MHWATSTPDSHSCPALECSGPLPTLFPSLCLPAGREAAPSGRPSWACYTPTTSPGTWLHPLRQSTLSSRNLGVCVCVCVWCACVCVHVSQEITCLWRPSCLTQHRTYLAVVNAEQMNEGIDEPSRQNQFSVTHARLAHALKGALIYSRVKFSISSLSTMWHSF